MSKLNPQPYPWQVRLFGTFWLLTLWFAILAFPQIATLTTPPDWYKPASELFRHLFLSCLLIWLIYIAWFSWFLWIGYPLNKFYKFCLSTISTIALLAFASDKLFWLKFLFEATHKANSVFQITFYACYILGGLLSILLIAPTAAMLTFYWIDWVICKGNPTK